jgi:hypothetical protein
MCNGLTGTYIESNSPEGNINYLCTYDLYGPVRNVFDAGRYVLWGSGGELALEISSFVGPWENARADRRVQFGAQKTRDFQRQPLPPTSPHNVSARIKNICTGPYKSLVHRWFYEHENPLIGLLHCKKWIFQKNVNMTSKDDEITHLLFQETFQLSYQF